MRILQRSWQSGVTVTGLILVLFVIIMVGIFGLKLIPVYIEYNKCKNAIEAIAADRSKTSSVAEVRKAFDNRANVDDITVLKGSDLEVTKDGGNVVISFGYRKEVPLFANIGLTVDFAASSR
jgi:Domain of unknown function (DUF4845)